MQWSKEGVPVPLGMEEEELRQVIAEQIRDHWRDAMAQQQLWPAKGVTATEQTPVPSGSGSGSQQQLNNIAHSLAHTQAEISRTLEASLRNLHDLADQAEMIATKIHSILRRTEPFEDGL